MKDNQRIALKIFEKFPEYEWNLVEVTRTDPLEKLVWTNKKDPDNERNKILNRTKDPHPA